MATPAFAQIELSGAYSSRMYQDYIERGPGEFIGNFTGMPLIDEGRAKALLYTSNQPSTYERQCLAQSAGIFQYRPRGIQMLKELDPTGTRWLPRSSAATISGARSGPGWTAGLIRRRTRSTPKAGSRPGSGKATR